MVNEAQVASFLRRVVETAYEKVDDVDTLLANVAAFAGSAVEVVKQGLVEADSALADLSKTEEVNLGNDLAQELVDEHFDLDDAHEREVEGDHAWDAETKLFAIQKAADEALGEDGHLWWLVRVTDNNRDAIDETYEKLKDGTLFG